MQAGSILISAGCWCQTRQQQLLPAARQQLDLCILPQLAAAAAQLPELQAVATAVMQASASGCQWLCQQERLQAASHLPLARAGEKAVLGWLHWQWSTGPLLDTGGSPGSSSC